MMTLNERAWRIADELEADTARFRIESHKVAGARIIDCGGAVDGSLAAGVLLARACLADLAEVSIITDAVGPAVQVTTDAPVLACLASQYAGWQIQRDGFFAMGSGPFRAASAREEIFNQIPGRENAPCAVGVLETSRHPTEEVVTYIVSKLPKSVEKLTLLVAPTSSIAGTVQVVARSVETALHKLHELKFDMKQVISGHGTAPLPPVAKDTMLAIGRTNDAILYGARVTLWVKCEDELLESIGPRVPSNASASHGKPFAELLKVAGGDFYKLDPTLFAPAEITFNNLKSGRAFRFGSVEHELLHSMYS